MSELEKNTDKQASTQLIRLTYIIYGLHAFSVLSGVLTSAFIVTAFLTGWPSIIAVIMSYVKRSDARGTYLESHFNWLIKTFWYSAFALLLAGILLITLVGIPLAVIIIIVVGLWVLYRIIRGVLNLMAARAMPMN